jgi:hypothetical protein
MGAPEQRPAAADRKAQYGALPARIPPEQLVTEMPAAPANDSQFSGDPDNEWMIRYSA